MKQRAIDKAMRKGFLAEEARIAGTDQPWPRNIHVRLVCPYLDATLARAWHAGVKARRTIEDFGASRAECPPMTQS